MVGHYGFDSFFQYPRNACLPRPYTHPKLDLFVGLNTTIWYSITNTPRSIIFSCSHSYCGHPPLHLPAVYNIILSDCFASLSSTIALSSSFHLHCQYTYSHRKVSNLRLFWIRGNNINDFNVRLHFLMFRRTFVP